MAMALAMAMGLWIYAILSRTSVTATTSTRLLSNPVKVAKYWSHGLKPCWLTPLPPGKAAFSKQRNTAGTRSHRVGICWRRLDDETL